jgi:hypothetical protein
MSKISGKLNLLNLHGVVKMIKGQSGMVECLVIPLEINSLFKGEKGIYLDIIAFEVDPAKRNAESKDTHLIKQSFPKDIRDLMSEEDLKKLPILGNLQVWSERTESAPVSNAATLKEEDDLPF